ncbi:MAG: hypothetical protein E7L17_14585 [Clostridium sp.]|uniref:hypothetical protein n=1 Tax=Clostridium sp. TaxID=1506 RepID=UPI00291198DD|nr:hypothetical protein [Clostridium sp.]MDU7339327.1 hypothetical protein [Clostridium sp.]
MQNILAPEVITKKIDELNGLVDQYPDFLPVEVVSRFLCAKSDGIRAYIDNAPNPFGISWQQMGKQNRAFKIPTVKFYLWYTNGFGYRKEV